MMQTQAKVALSIHFHRLFEPAPSRHRGGAFFPYGLIDRNDHLLIGQAVIFVYKIMDFIGRRACTCG